MSRARIGIHSKRFFEQARGGVGTPLRETQATEKLHGERGRRVGVPRSLQGSFGVSRTSDLHPRVSFQRPLLGEDVGGRMPSHVGREERQDENGRRRREQARVARPDAVEEERRSRAGEKGERRDDGHPVAQAGQGRDERHRPRREPEEDERRAARRRPQRTPVAAASARRIPKPGSILRIPDCETKNAYAWLSRGSSACVSQASFERTTRASPEGSDAARRTAFLVKYASSPAGGTPARAGSAASRSHGPFGRAFWTPPDAGSLPSQRLTAP